MTIIRKFSAPIVAFFVAILLFVPVSGAHAAVADSLLDRENIFSQQEKEALSQDISALRTRYDVYVGILTSDTFNGMTGEQYARSQGNRLGLGESWKNNGFLFVISMNDRKVGFAYGDGIHVSNPEAQTIINDMLFHLKRNDPYDASIAGMKELNSYFSANGINNTSVPDSELTDAQFNIISASMVVILTAVIGVIVFSAMRNRRNRKIIENSPITKSQIKELSTMNDADRRRYVENNGYFGMDSTTFPWMALMYMSNEQRSLDYAASHPGSGSSSGSSFGGGSFGGGGASGSW